MSLLTFNVPILPWLVVSQSLDAASESEQDVDADEPVEEDVDGLKRLSSPCVSDLRGDRLEEADLDLCRCL